MEGQPADLLRDPADLSPAERTHDLVAAVARDDLLAVVLVLHSADPEDVLAVDAATGRTALETALQLPTRRDDIRHLVTQCLLVCAPPETALPAAAPAADPSRPFSSSAGWRALQEWRTGGEQQAPDAVRLCFDMTMAQVEDWITEHGFQVPDSPRPPPPSSSEAEPPPSTGESAHTSPPAAAAAAAAVVVKTEPAVAEFPSPVRIKHEPSPLGEDATTLLSSTVPAVATGHVPSAVTPPSHPTDPSPATPLAAPPTPSPSPLGGGGPTRLEIRHLPLSINIISLRDLVGASSTRHISLDVSLEHNEVTALVETDSFQTARAAVERLRGYVYSDGSEERTLHAELCVAAASRASSTTPVAGMAAAVPVPRPRPQPPHPPPPPPPLSSSALPPSCPPSPARDSKPLSTGQPPPPSSPTTRTRGEPSRRRGSPDERAARDRRRSASPRRRQRRGDESIPERPAYSPRGSGPGRSSSPAERRTTTMQRPRSDVHWLYVTGVSPRMCERALADILAREGIEAYDIRVDLPPAYRRHDREERVATIGFTSPRDMTRARSALDPLVLDGLRMHCRTYRDPRTGGSEPPMIEEGRYPYVTHRSNLAHPPHPRARGIVITGLDPSTYLREAEIREWVESECGDYTVVSVRIDQKYAARAYVEMDRTSAAIRAIERLDGMIDRGHAITVNWDGRPAQPRRAPSPPPPGNGFTSQPFRRYGDP